MSKSARKDHEFDIERFNELFLKAKGERNQTAFANDSGLSVAYICKQLSGKQTTPPIPSTIRKIAAAACNGVTYADLLDAAGYDPAKYVTLNPVSSENPKNPEKKEKIARAIVFSALSEGNFEWSFFNSQNNTGILPADMVVEIKNSSINQWNFHLISDTEGCLSEKDSFKTRMYMYYGYLATMAAPSHVKYSFITDSNEVFEKIKALSPRSLAAVVSVILIDMDNLSILKEENISGASNINAPALIKE